MHFSEFLRTHSVKDIGNKYVTFYEIEFLDCNVPNLTQWIMSEKHRTQCLNICDCIVACIGKEECGNVEKKKKHITLNRGDGNLLDFEFVDNFIEYINPDIIIF